MRIVSLLFFCFLVIPDLSSQQYFDSLFLDQKAFVYFDSGSSELDSTDHAVIDSLIEKSMTLDTFVIKVFAHTDNVGQEDFNLKLSQARAGSVHQYLETRSAGDKTQVAHFGESTPMNANATEEEKAINRRVELQLYEVKSLQWISGKVVNDSTSLPIENALIRLHSKQYFDSTYTNIAGEFKVSAPINEGVGIDVIAPGQMPKLIFKKLTSEVAAKPIIIKTEVIAIGKKFELKRVYFVGDMAIVLPSSRKAIPTLKEFMSKNRGTCIRIEGHVNLPNQPNIPRETQTFELSVARAKTLHDILKEESKVDTTRMQYLGKGNWEMAFPKAIKEPEMRKNRRVEVVIASCEETKHAINDTLSGKYNFWKEFKFKNVPTVN